MIKTIDSSVIKNKVKKELKNGNWKLVVNPFKKEASISFKSEWLNMMFVEVEMTYIVSSKECFNHHNINGISCKQDLSTVEVDSFEYKLHYNGSEHSIELTEYEENFAEIIAEYFTPFDL